MDEKLIGPFCKVCRYSHREEPSWSDVCVACEENPNPDKYRHSNFRPVRKSHLEARGLTLQDWESAWKHMRELDPDFAKPAKRRDDQKQEE